MLLFGVLGFIVLVFLLLVAFGGTQAPVVKRPDMPALKNMGLVIAEDNVKHAGWSEVVAYDATGQDRSLRDRRDWRVCFQRPAAGKQVVDRAEPLSVIDNREQRKAGEVWLGVVHTDEDCNKLGNDFGVASRVYDLTGSPGTNAIPNLYHYTAHMARLAFGEDASIRVTRIPVKNADGKTEKPSRLDLIKEQVLGEKGIKADDSDEIGSGWDDWMICTQIPNYVLDQATPWNGTVVELNVVRYGDNCSNPTMP